MSNGKEIPISRQYRDEFMNLFTKYLKQNNSLGQNASKMVNSAYCIENIHLYDIFRGEGNIVLE